MDKSSILMPLCFILVGFVFTGGLVWYVYNVEQEPIDVSGVLERVEYGDDCDTVVIGRMRYSVVLQQSKGEVESMIGRAVNLQASKYGGKASLSLIGGVN